MGVPTSEVGYTSAMPRREDHEVHKDMWSIVEKKKTLFLVPSDWNVVHLVFGLTQHLFRGGDTALFKNMEPGTVSCISVS